MPPIKPSNVFKNAFSPSSSSSSSKSSGKPSSSSSSSPAFRKPAPPGNHSPAAAQNAVASTKNDDDNDDDDDDDDSEEEEDDYMSLTFADPSPSSSKHESSIQRVARLKREAEARSRPKSKAELAAEEKRKRDEALATSISGGKGLNMMKKMGFKVGGGLGRPSTTTSSEGGGDDDSERRGELEKRLTEPLVPVIKETRSGIGHDAHVKRKFASEHGGDGSDAKREKVSDDDYRSRLNAENKARRQEGQYYACQKVCERLSAEDLQDGTNKAKENKKKKGGFEAIRKTPVVWRGLLWHRERREQDAKIRHDVMTSGVSRVTEIKGYTADVEMDADDKVAFGLDGRDAKGRKIMEEEGEGEGGGGTGKISTEEVVLEDEWEDPELEEFEAMEPGEKLAEILKYIRGTWNYCFWCKSRYPDEAMEGCPGVNEDDHD